jgi:hypothetical protein
MGRVFQAPVANTAVDGTVTVSLWEEGRAALRPGHDFFHHTYRFTRLGKFSAPDERALEWHDPTQ